MDPVIYAIALVSFLAGSFGYVFVRFVVLPLFRYRRIRRRIALLLKRVESAERGETAAETSPPRQESRRAGEMRRLSTALSDCFTDQLPHWYRLYLTGRRGHAPLEAAKHLLALANIRDASHATRRMEKIGECLGIRVPVS